MIKKLPDCIIARIAAGEVIVSPYNIIKECIENSIDASASSITVSLSSTLLSFEIKDNGCGISKEDLGVVCLNHYTSKTESLNDIYRCGTIKGFENFGFRGEALHSISVSSKVKIYSKNDESLNYGYCGVYELGELVKISKIPMERRGTIVEVSDIFYKNQIRKELFYKNKKEIMNCINLIKSYGCIYSGIEMMINSKVIVFKDLNRKKVCDLKECDIIGANNEIVNSKTKYIKNVFLENKVDVSEIERILEEKYLIIFTNRFVSFKKYMFILFVNNRLVNNAVLKSKILQKYKNLIKKGMYPFVYIEVFVEYADVNVHPSKSEVLIGESDLYDEIADRISSGLNTNTISIKEIDTSYKIESKKAYTNQKIESDRMSGNINFERGYSYDSNYNKIFHTQGGVKVYSSSKVRDLEDFDIKKRNNNNDFLLHEKEDSSNKFRDLKDFDFKKRNNNNSFNDSFLLNENINLNDKNINNKLHDKNINNKLYVENIKLHNESIHNKLHNESIHNKLHDKNINNKLHNGNINNKLYVENINLNDKNINNKLHNESINLNDENINNNKLHNESINLNDENINNNKLHNESIHNKLYDENINNKVYVENIYNNINVENINNKLHTESVYNNINVENTNNKLYVENINLNDENINLNYENINNKLYVENINNNKLHNESIYNNKLYDENTNNKLYVENIKLHDEHINNKLHIENYELTKFQETTNFDFIKSLIFVGCTDGYIFAQAHSNLIKIERFNFLSKIFYDKIKCAELESQKINACGAEIPEKYWEVLGRFGILIADYKVVKAPIICGAVMKSWDEFKFPRSSLEKLISEHEGISTVPFEELKVSSSFGEVARIIADFYKTIPLNSKIFNNIKRTAIETVDIYKSFKILVALKDLYKKFGRC